MSSEGEQQRRPGAPDDTDGRRRLRAISYPDPYLVTKLPLEGTVNSGVIRLGERMLLGFIHRPYPDGTRVQVVYDEWLFAERLEEEPDDEAPGSKRATDKGAAKGKVKGSATGAGKSATAGAGKSARRSAAAGADKSAAAGAGKSARRSATAGADKGTTSFPDDFSDAEREALGDRIGGGDAWTEAFGDDRDG